jgi:Domain of unknown function (DUF4375)
MGLPRLDGYSGQTTAELFALESRYRTDSLALAFEQGIARKAARIGIERLTSAERIVLAVEAGEREVNSGGYLGLFSWTPEHVPLVVSSLHAIDRGDVADLTRRAIDAPGISGPITVDAVKSAVEDEDDDRDELLDAIDTEYFALEGDLAEPVLTYVRANRDQITLP